ncbi:hypothetical protein NE591_14565, partial [Adlercreutzia sp. DFI.6.23]|nr:hypothetical protein [Adlercreutzia sp. DFI.6.23]
LENAQVEALAERIRFSTWEKLGDGRTVNRLVTSWSTTPDDLAALEAALHEVMQELTTPLLAASMLSPSPLRAPMASPQPA